MGNASHSILVAIDMLVPKKNPFASRELTKFLKILEEAHITVYILRRGNEEVTFFHSLV